MSTGRRDGVRRVRAAPTRHRGARLGHVHHRARDRAIRLPLACRHSAERARDVRHRRSQLQLRGDPRVRQAGGLQQPHSAADQRAPRERQHLRPGGDRAGVRPRSRDVRTCGNHPWTRIVTLRRQRVLRRRQRHHAVRRVARRRFDHAGGRHAGVAAGAGQRRAPAGEWRGRRGLGDLCAERWRAADSTFRRSTPLPPTMAWPRGSMAKASGNSTAG